MMRGPYTSAMAVRKPDGEIYLETWETNGTGWYTKVPLLRGVCNLFLSLATGYRCLMKSAEISGMAVWVFNLLVTVLAMFLSIGLFMLLPSAIVKWVGSRFAAPAFVLTSIEGLIKIAVFILYLFAVSRMKDIYRVFQYHGAEHKTIACYEAAAELSPDNAKNYPRFHPRCGTSFLLIVLVISILVFSVVTWSSVWMRVALKILLLPVVVGIAYEIIRFAGRHDNPLTRAVSAPGLWLQNLTTFEPDESQLEVAIAAMKPCIPDDGTDNY